MGRREKPRTLMEQNRRLCGAICLCQLTVVLSAVSLIYLSVAVYMPSHRAFHSGFAPTPVMCQTTRTNDVNNCNWASCGEWCLTKTTGFCPQMHVTVRQNATDLLLSNCSSLSNVSCPPADPNTVKRYNCNQGSECDELHGVFNCSLGHCGNYSERFLCHYKADGVVLNTEKDNMKLNGFFECNRSLCTKIKRPFSCDRYCPKITTTSMNVFLMFEDSLFTGECREAFALNRARGNDPGVPVEPIEVWHEDRSGGALLASCLSVVRVGNNSLRATDCLNGTVLDEKLIPQPYMNFTTFWSLYGGSSRPLDPEGRYLPPQRALTIYNQSRLYINLEGCVNTLRGECRDFLATHGRDGANQTAQSRFPCYYHPDDSFMAIARFDLDKTLRDLLIATLVPAVLFVVSFVTLVCITKYVTVDDAGRMRCTLCSALCAGCGCSGCSRARHDDGDLDGPGPESSLMNSERQRKSTTSGQAQAHAAATPPGLATATALAVDKDSPIIPGRLSVSAPASAPTSAPASAEFVRKAAAAAALSSVPETDKVAQGRPSPGQGELPDLGTAAELARVARAEAGEAEGDAVATEAV